MKSNQIGKHLKVKAVSLTKAAKKDCDTLKINPEEAIAFVNGEAKRHPLMFESQFASIPLVFGENVLLLSWDLVTARIGRVLYRQEAYPLNDGWASCLGLYRKTLLLPYRTQGTDRLIISSEGKRTISMFKKLIQETQEYASDLKRHTDTVVRNLPDLEHLYDEADFALTNGDIGTVVARLEALLSSIHKLIIEYAPQGKGSPSIKQSLPLDLPIADPNKTSVLIVDDCNDMREVMKVFLERHGFQCYEATCSREAMQILVENDFDLIITDLVMPNTDSKLGGMDGRELVLAAKSSGSRAKIVVWSAYSVMAHKSEVGTDKFPCDVFLEKPTSSNELINIIKKLLGQSHDTKQENR